MNEDKQILKQEKKVITNIEVTTIKDDEVKQLQERIDNLSDRITSLKAELAYYGFFKSILYVVLLGLVLFFSNH